MLFESNLTLAIVVLSIAVLILSIGGNDDEPPDIDMWK